MPSDTPQKRVGLPPMPRRRTRSQGRRLTSDGPHTRSARAWMCDRPLIPLGHGRQPVRDLARPRSPSRATQVPQKTADCKRLVQALWRTRIADPLLTMAFPRQPVAAPRQPVAAHGNAIRLSEPLSPPLHCHRLPPVATARLHKCSIPLDGVEDREHGDWSANDWVSSERIPEHVSGRGTNNEAIVPTAQPSAGALVRWACRSEQQD
jgi:hypothetical protein